MIPITGNVDAQPRKVSCKLQIGGNTITNVKRLTYSSDWSGNVTIGQVVSSYITATIPTPSDFTLTSANVAHSMGIGSSSVEWVAIGNYTVDHNSIKTKQGYTTFTAHDKLYNNNTYTKNALHTFPETVQGLCDDVCDQLGIGTVTNLGNIGATGVDKASLNGYTLRDVLGFVAAVCGTNAYVNANNDLVLKWFSATSYIADGTKANIPYVGESDCTVSRLICQGSDGVYTYGSDEGIYFTCPIVNESNQAAILSYIHGILGLTYRKADIDIPYGNFCLQSGDIITVTTVANQSFSVPIMSNSWTYDGGLSSSVSAYGVSDYTGTANNAAHSISDRKVQERIETQRTITREVEYASALITGAKGGIIRINMGGNGKPAEFLILDTGDIDTAVRVFRLNENGLGFSNTGYNGSYETAITYDGLIVADRITGNKISGVKLETIATGTGLSAPSQVVVEDGTYTINKVSNGTVSNVGKMEYKDRSSVSDNDSLSIQVKSGASFTIGVLDANGGLGNPEFFYYSDLSQAPSGAEKYQLFGGNLKIIGNNLIVNGQSGGDVLFGDSGNISLRSLYNEIYDPNNGILKRLSDLESRVSALE